MNFYPIYKNKKLLPWIKWWILKGNKIAPKHLSEWINSASAITLTGVYKGSPLLYLNLNGNTSQDGTPTPEAPVPVNIVKGNNTIKINDTDYQINLKSKNLFDKDYEPYYDYELCKIGDYQDVIYKESNKWYVDKYIGKVVLNGTENIGYQNTVFTFAFNDVHLAQVGENLLLVLSDKYLGITSRYRDNFTDLSIGKVAGNNYQVAIKNSDYTSVADFKTWLTNNNTTVYYVLAESTTTEITETNLITQLEAIYNAKLQSGTNTITQTNTDLPFYLNFQYYEKG